MNGHFSKKNAVTIFMCLILTIIYIGGCAEDMAFLKKGKEFASREAWDQSVQHYQKALAANPDNTEVQLLLRRAKFAASMTHMVKGQEYLNRQLYSEAIGEFKMSISYHPANRKANGLMEKALNAKKSVQYYRRGKEVLVVRKGDRIDGKYTVEDITDQTVTLKARQLDEPLYIVVGEL